MTVKPSRILSGIQPTGIPHLGNYLGALRSWVEAQSGNECMPMIADLHALTVPQVSKELMNNTRTLTVSLLAMGIDTNKSILFRQSRISQHAELAWIFFCRTPVGWVKRMHQWKTKAGSDASLNIGLLSYPILQAADIMLYKATKVPVGDDQSQHLNLAADICQSFNGHYGKKVFPVPQGGKHRSYLILVSNHGKRIMSLRHPRNKMSKSDANVSSRILINDSDDQIVSKIKKATTDTQLGISWDPEERPGIANLLNIMSCILNEDPESLAHKYANYSNRQLKELASDAIISLVKPIREEMNRIDKEVDVELLLRSGESRAREIAENTMQEVRQVVGLA